MREHTLESGSIVPGLSEQPHGVTKADQLARLRDGPDPDLVTPPDKYVSAPYLEGEVVKWLLNGVFGSDGWGYELLEWPELVPMHDGSDGYYRCRGTVWFRFADGTVLEREVPGLCALRPGRGKGLEDAIFEQMRMAYEGAITDMIKGGASTLGPLMGLGLANKQLAQKLRLLMGPRNDPERDMEEITGRRTAPPPQPRPRAPAPPPERTEYPAGTQPPTWGSSGPPEPPEEAPEEPQGEQPKKAAVKTHWIDDKETRAKFFAGLAERGLSESDAKAALKVESIHQYQGSVTDAWIEIRAWLAQRVVNADDIPF